MVFISPCNSPTIRLFPPPFCFIGHLTQCLADYSAIKRHIGAHAIGLRNRRQQVRHTPPRCLSQSTNATHSSPLPSSSFAALCRFIHLVCIPRSITIFNVANVCLSRLCLNFEKMAPKSSPSNDLSLHPSY